MSLYEIKEAFETNPTNKTAGAYMAALLEHDASGVLSYESLLEGLRAVRDYLQWSAA